MSTQRSASGVGLRAAAGRDDSGLFDFPSGSPAGRSAATEQLYRRRPTRQIDHGGRVGDVAEQLILVGAGALVDRQRERDEDSGARRRQVVPDGRDRLAVIARLFAETSGGRLTATWASMGIRGGAGAAPRLWLSASCLAPDSQG